MMFETIRIQAENALRGRLSGAADPLVVTLAGLPEGDSNRPYADAADGDAYVDFTAVSGQFIEFKVTVTDPGLYDIDIGYALSSTAGARPMRLDVNGALFDRMFNLPAASATGSDFDDYLTQTARVSLVAGENTIRLTTNGANGPNIDYLEVRAPDPARIVIQAEDLLDPAPLGAPTSVNRPITLQYLIDRTAPEETFRIGADGDAYLDWAGGAATLDFPVTATIAGTYSVIITYANDSTPRPVSLSYANGDPIGTFAIARTTIPAGYAGGYVTDFADIPLANRPSDSDDPGTDPNLTGWEGWRPETLTANVTLAAGQNLLRLATTGAGPNIDKIEFVLVEAAPVAPTQIAIDDLVVIENVAGAEVGQVAVTDADSTSHTVQVFEGDALSARFEVVGGALRLKAGVALDFEATASFPIRVVATDAQGGSISRDFTVTVANDAADDEAPNTAPTGLTLTGSVAENAAGAVVGVLSATDAQGDPLTWSTTDARFVIVGSELRLADGVSLNFEATSGATVSVTASDGQVGTTADLALTVTDVNEAPTLQGAESARSVTAGQSFSISETVAAADQDAGDLPVIGARLVGGSSLPAGLSFSGRTFNTTAELAAGQYQLELFATDGALQSAAEVFTLTVAAAEPTPFTPLYLQAEDAVVFNGATTVTADDTQVRDPSNPETGNKVLDANGLRPGYSGDGYVDYGIGTASVGDFTRFSVDVPTGGTYTLHFRFANGGTTARPLALSVNGVTAASQPQFPGSPVSNEAAWNTWRIQTVDVVLTAGTNTVALTIPSNSATGPNLDALAVTQAGGTPSFFAPVFTSATTATVAENAVAPALDVNATDGDGQALTYSLTGQGADDALFVIDAATGALSFKAAPDFETPADVGADNAYQVQVSVTDGFTAVTQAVTVTVSDVNEQPTPFTPVVIQGEAATLTILDVDPNTNDTTVRNASNPEGPSASLPNGGLRPGYSGAGYLDFGDTPGDAAAFMVDVPVAGTYDLNIRYATSTGRPLNLSVNGGAATSLPFASTATPEITDGFNNWDFQTVTVTLAAGRNTLSLAIPAGAVAGPNIDRIELTTAGTGPIDTSADEDGNLLLTGPATVDPDQATAVAFTALGRDADIVKTEVSFDGGATRQTVAPTTAGGFTLDLSGRPAGANTVSLFVTDDAGNQARADRVVTVAQGEPPAFNQVIQGESWTVTDTTTGTALQTTQARTPANPEPNAPARDVNGDRLWDGFSGSGYMDMGANVGDAVGFTVNAPTAGTYTLTFRYANGGGDAQRPMTLSVGGAVRETVSFAQTGAGGWDNWQEVSVEVELQAGANVVSLANTLANGPNIDRVTITNDVEEPTEPGPREVIKINFQDGATPKAAGYLVDNFQGYGDRGGGLTYGWVTEASVLDADGTTSTPINGANYPAIAINERTGGVFDTYDPRLTGYAHFDLGGYPARTAWEMEVENGWYEVTVSVGDTGGPNDSVNRLLIEGGLASSFVPTNIYKSELVTALVQVTDGRLTLSAPAGTITEMQYLEVRALPDLTPNDGRAAPEDYAAFDQPRAVSGSGPTSRQVDLSTGDGTPAVDVDPTSDIFLGVQTADGRGGILLESLQDGSIRLYETLTGQEVAFTANTTAGFDSLTITPVGDLDPFTSYTLVIDGARDNGASGAAGSTTREFQKFTTSFTTGAAPVVTEREVAFRDTVEINGAADGAMQLTTVEISPDGKHLYAASLTGEIKRWVLNPDGSLGDEQVLRLAHFAGDGAGPRGIVGFTFDPTNPNVVWVSDNYPVPLEGRSNSVPDFSGRVSKLTLGTGDAFTATATTYITGLPRSNGDHLSNSLEFRANPDAGQPGQPSHLLYLIQGSNSAMGAPDDAWGNRGERLLSAAVLEIDPTRTPPAGGFNVQTEPTPPNNTTNSASIFNENGTVTGWYNPFAADAVLNIFATGTRNAYDLVWHSNGNLYVPTNGSAAGGNTPDDPTTAINEQLANAGLQSDYLFRVEEGGYYGHPNALRDEYVLNGGNPTSGVDRNEVLAGGGRTGYQVGVLPDENYRIADAYSLGNNRSPNGATEYTSNIFGGSLKSALLFTEYSGGNDVRAVLLDENGRVREDFVLRNTSGQVIQYVDPLDIIENPRTGQLYLLTLNRSNGQSQIVRLDPAPGGVVEPPPPPPPPPGRELLFTVQAEDNTPGDGTAVSIPTAAQGAQIQIRTMQNPETGQTGLVNGLRPGAFGLDGNNVDNDGLTGGYADFGSTNNDFLTFTITVDPAKAGASVLVFRYATPDSPTEPDGGARPLAITVNGVAVAQPAFTPGAGATADERLANWQTVEVPANLVAGVNTIRLQAVNATGPNIDQMQVFRVVAAQPGTGIYEAESAQLTPGAIVDAQHAGYSGSGFVDYVTNASDPNPEITWTIQAATAGTYEVQVRYANRTESGPRPLGLEVNGVSEGTVPFAPVGPLNTDYGLQTFTVTLKAGANTLSLTAPGGVGPNIDYLRVPAEPIAPPFTANYVDIPATGGRIELEATDGSARKLGANTAEFFFNVGSDGLYALDFAANVDADDGGGVTLFLNGQRVTRADFPGSTEETVYIPLTAGQDYRLQIVSDQSGANELDYLDVRPAPGNVNADIAVQSLDPAFFDNRLHFSFIEDPDAVDPASPDRDFKDTGTVRITNTGTQPLNVLDHELSGPFVLANPTQLNGLTLAAGQSIDVQVNFNRAAYTPPTSSVDATSTIFSGALRLVTNDADSPIMTVDLAGFWQARDEGGQEPNVNEIWKIFGFGNVIEGLRTTGGGENSTLSTKDVFAKTDETEVLSPYWTIAEGFTQARITHLAAFHGPGGATVHLHNPGNKNANVLLWNHEGTDNQTLLPNAGNDATFATRVFDRGLINDAWIGNEVFGISVAGLSTDPRLNPRGDELVPGAQQGHTVKMFQALDANGAVIPNVYLGIMDYTGINYDYNDNIFVIEGVRPVGFGQELRVSGLDDAAADDRLVFTNIETPANASQAFRNEATVTLTNDGFTPLNISGVELGDPANFQIVGTVPASLAPGASVQITVRFTGVHAGTTPGADLIKSTLTIRSDDFDQGVKVVQLAGLAQETSEGGSEPTVAQIVEAFGYGTNVAQAELNGGGAVETIGDEVLLPYLQKLDATKPVEVIQIGAFLNQGNVARLGHHGLNSSVVTNILANDDQQGQTVLPDALVSGSGSGASVARGTINQNTPFGIYISVDGRPTYSSWSDPEANDVDPTIGGLVSDGQGHLIRYFQALDANGDVIPGTFIGVQDYPGAGNFDYNDHMFIIKNVQAYSLTAADDANNNSVNDALERDTDGDGLVDFFDRSSAPPPPAQAPVNGTAPLVGATDAPVVIGATAFDLGGQGVAYNDTTASDQGGTQGRNEGVDIVGNNTAVGWTAPGEWIEYTINVAQAGAYTLVFNAAAPNAGSTIGATFAKGGTVYATAANAAVPDTDSYTAFANTQPVTVNLQAGEQVVRLNLSGGFDLKSFALDRVDAPPPPPPPVQAPFGGAAPLIGSAPVTVDATRFDTGGQGVAFNDTTSQDLGGSQGRNEGVDIVGNNQAVGWIENGEWIEYTINVAEAGDYTLTFNAATPDGGRSITASFAQAGAVYATAASAAVPDTNSYTTFANTQPVTVALKAGEQVVRLNLAGGAFDLDSFTLDRVDAPPPPPPPVQAPFGGTAPVIGTTTAAVTLDATRFDTGGQGVAFNDTTAQDLGGSQGRNEGVDIVGNNQAVGWIENGEWLEYTVNVAQAGNYTLSFNTASVDGGRSITASFAQGGAVYATAASAVVPDTNSWTAYADTQPVTVALKAGEQVIRLNLAGGAFDLNTFTLDRVDAPPPPPPPVQTPFGAVPVIGSSPAAVTVDATRFDNGGQNVAWFDTSPGDLGGAQGRNTDVDIVGNNQAVGWIGDGEWVEYTITVAQTANYTLSFAAAAPNAGSSIQATFAQGGAVYATAASAAVPDTNNYTSFTGTQPVTVALKAGEQVVRLNFQGGNFDLDSFTLDRVEAPPASGQRPFGGEAVAIGLTSAPVTVDATRFDLGGQGVAFNDTTPTTDEGGPAGRNEGVDVIGANQAVGWIRNGEWIEYTVDVKQAGAYALTFNAATPFGGRYIEASFEQNGAVYETSARANIVDTDSWTIYRSTQAVTVDLLEGQQVIRLNLNGGVFDLDSFTLDLLDSAPMTRMAASQPVVGTTRSLAEWLRIMQTSDEATLDGTEGRPLDYVLQAFLNQQDDEGAPMDPLATNQGWMF